eukprot:6478344-Amphidinium_carterae.1
MLFNNKGGCSAFGETFGSILYMEEQGPTISVQPVFGLDERTGHAIQTQAPLGHPFDQEAQQ